MSFLRGTAQVQAETGVRQPHPHREVELPEFRPILGSEKTRFYRNKLEFTFSNKRWLTEEEVKQDVKYDQMNAVGFHIPGAFDKVLAIDKCWLQDDISNHDPQCPYATMPTRTTSRSSTCARRKDFFVTS